MFNELIKESEEN